VYNILKGFNFYFHRGYLAPEFFNGKVAFASDIYSLGIIIMEILTGAKGYPEDENVRAI
jgi:serine/threonine protein kinase